MENVIENARKGFIENMKNLKNSYQNLTPTDRAKMENLEKKIMECYKNGDINSLNKIVKECQLILNVTK